MKPFVLHEWNVKTKEQNIDEIKSIFHLFKRAFTESNKTISFWKVRVRLEVFIHYRSRKTGQERVEQTEANSESDQIF